jgi:CHAT domain-containing protein
MMSRISSILSEWFRTPFPRLWAYFRFSGDFIRTMFRFESIKDPAIAAKVSAEFVRRTLDSADFVIQCRPGSRRRGRLRSISLLWTIWTLNLIVVIGIFIAYRDGAELSQEELRRLIRIAQTILEFHEIRAENLQRLRFKWGGFSILRRYERMRRLSDLVSHALPHIVLAVAYTQLDVGDLSQSLQQAFTHYQVASKTLAKEKSQALNLMSAGVLAALGTAYLNYPAENRCEYARRAIEALGEAREVAAQHIGPALEAARQGMWKEIYLGKASLPTAARYTLRLASATRHARLSKGSPDPIMYVIYAPMFVAWLDWKLGVAHKERGEYDAALAQFDSALTSLELLRAYGEATGPTSRNMRATILVSKGSVYLEKWSNYRREDIRQQVAIFSEAIKLANKLPADRRGLKTYALSLIGDARAYFALEEAGRVSKDRREKLRSGVVKELRVAGRLARKAGAFQITQQALVLLGKVYLLQGDKARAWRSFAVGSRLLDRMQSRSRSYRLSRYWVSAAASLYELLISTALEYVPAKGSPARKTDPPRTILGSAFSHLERGRTLFLQRELANHDPLPAGGRRDDPLLQQFFRLRRQYLEAEMRFLDWEMTPEFPVPASARVPGIRDQLPTIEASYLKELDGVRQKYHDFEYDPDRLAPPIAYKEFYELVEKLWHITETAVIEYFVSDRYLIAAIFLPGYLVVKHAGISRTDLWDIETHWRDGYEKLTSGRISSLHWELGYLQQVLNRLRPAVERAMESIAEWERMVEHRIKRIIIIPHRFLHLIPLHAMELPKTGIWGDVVQIQYAPSASVLSQLMDLRLAMKNEILEHPRSAVTVAVAYASAKHPLIFHEEEARAVAKACKGGKIIIGPDATRARVKEAIRDADYIHFACHGGFDDIDPLNGGLTLAPDSNGSTQSDLSSTEGHRVVAENAPLDGDRLRLGEIFQEVRLQQARLVVLSACETGLTKVEQRHEEYIGLPAGFLHAGATTVISSLWPVNDIATWLLMRSFAKRIASGSGSAAALYASQRKLRALSRDAVLQEIATAAQKEPDPLRRERMLEQGQLLQGEFPFVSPYWWAGFTVNGVGGIVMRPEKTPSA